MNMTKTVKATRNKVSANAEVNYMGGISFKLSPIETLKLVSASSIFGEPSYYRDGAESIKYIAKENCLYKEDGFVDYILPDFTKFSGKNTAEIMEQVIDEALNEDFMATLDWAVELRNKYLMRLNPQIIMVRAAIHPNRKDFTANNPKSFADHNSAVMSRADDVISQLTYYLYINKDKNNIPGLLKKSWANKINSLSRYELYKYRNHGIGLIDTIRICHAHGNDIDELMKTGTIDMPEDNLTWETLKATGKSWSEIVRTIKMNHMALLRNLRGIFSEITDKDVRSELLNRLEKGVPNGKQFPFRYMSAHTAVEHSDVVNKTSILDSLERCMDKSCENLPTLPGTNAFLSDNSGSAWGAFNSEYGTVTVAEIGNLSCLIGAVNSDNGKVFTFGDRLIEHEVSKRQGILSQAKELNKKRTNEVGGSTENGIWIFFRDAIDNHIHYDNIFIYSDMQAGHGGLYGTREDLREYSARGYNIKGNYIHVAKLIDDYRKLVNPKVNVFCVQTAGYTNSLVESGYRTSIISGWTGKEIIYADTVNKFWDAYDKK